MVIKTFIKDHQGSSRIAIDMISLVDTMVSVDSVKGGSMVSPFRQISRILCRTKACMDSDAYLDTVKKVLAESAVNKRHHAKPVDGEHTDDIRYPVSSFSGFG